MTRPRSRNLAGLAIAVVTIAGCRSKEQGAREHFSKDVTCPEDRVEVKARTDLHPSDWLEKRTPPADIASDPGRLSMWQAQQADLRSRADTQDDIFEASGCGTQKLYACHRHNKDLNYIMCFSQSYPASPGSSPAPAPVATGAYADSAAVGGVKRSLSPAFRTCINKGLTTDPKMTGSAQIVAEIDRSGKVSSARTAGSLPASVRSCLQSQVEGALFPAPPGGPATITIPVNLGGS